MIAFSVLVILWLTVVPVAAVLFLNYCFPGIKIWWFVALALGTTWGTAAMAYIGAHCFP